MKRWIALWLFSLVVVAAPTSSLTAAYVRQGSVTVLGDSLPWSMGAKVVERGPNDSTYARDAFINLPVSCGVFSPSKAVIMANEVFIRRVPNTPRDMVAELRGGVQILYTMLHE